MAEITEDNIKSGQTAHETAGENIGNDNLETGETGCDCNGCRADEPERCGCESKSAGQPEKEKGRKDIFHKKEIEKLKGELSELNDRYLRMIAEYDNFRKRAQKERDSAYADAYIDAVAQILPVLDNLERASFFNDPESVSQGINMIVKNFREILEKMEVKEIEAIDTPFNPEVHNAVMHIEDSERGEGEIVEVLQKGYERSGKIIRYAMVKVAN